MDFTREQFDAQSALLDDPNFLREITGKFLQHILNEEFAHHLGAHPYERSQNRRGQRNGYYSRQIHTRVGSIELAVPRDRSGEFSTELFQRYQRTEKALVLALAEMYFNGVSTRKVSHIVEELCGHGISKSQVSELSKELGKDLEEWRLRPLKDEWAYLLLDAIYLKVREGGRVASVATFVAIGVSREGHREVLGCQVATSEYRTEWKSFLRSLKDRGMNIPLMVGSDNHDGLRDAITEELTSALWQRCQVHYMRNFLGKLGAKQQGEMVPLLRSVLHADVSVK